MKNIKTIIAFLFVFMMFLQASAQKKSYNSIEFSKRNFVDTLKIKIWDGALGYDLVVRGLLFKFDTQDSLMIVTDRKGFFSKEEKGQPTLKYKRYHKT